MHRVKRVISSKEFSVYLFEIVALLFSAPFLVLKDIMQRQLSLYFYLFVVWGMIVLVLFFMSKSYED